jgi:signal transduction histidine kinase
MSKISQSPWERVLRDLHREFGQLERGLSLLQEIDQSILTIGADGREMDLENLFNETIAKFSKNYHVDQPLRCYVRRDSEFILLEKGDGIADSPPVIRIAKPFTPPATTLRSSSSPYVILSRTDDEVLFQQFPNDETILLCPMFSEQNHLIAAFLVADRGAREISRLNDPAFANAVLAIVSQLTIAFNHCDRLRRNRGIRQLWDSFLSSNLSPTQSFQEVARRVPNFLPSFGPIAFRGANLGVQIMILSTDTTQGKRELVIRGTTGAEPEGTRIAIGRSISGLLIEHSAAELPYFCGDPTGPEFAHLYREYLGKEHPIRTELAVRMVLNGTTVGIINLETETPDAFNVHHINAILQLAEVLAPIISVFERRLEMNSAMQLSVASSTARYLSGLASVFRHSIRTPLASLRLNIEQASGIILKDSAALVARGKKSAEAGDRAAFLSTLLQLGDSLTSTTETFELLDNIQSQIGKYTEDFLGDMDRYSVDAPLDVRDVVRAAATLVTESLLHGKPIRFEFGFHDGDPPPIVFASPLLKQHLYSIFHNSVLAIQARIESNPEPGVITLDIRDESPPDRQEKQLNSLWALSIRDNGNGVRPHELMELNRFYPGTRFREDQGQGFGLVAVQRYIASIGGRIKLNSQYGEFFEVKLLFPKERPTDPW